MLFFSIINRYLQWKDHTYHSQSPSNSTEFQVSFHSRKDAILNHQQFGTACQHVVLQPLFGAAILLDHQIKAYANITYVLFPAPGWGNPYVIDVTFLTLQGQGVVAASLRGVAAGPLKVTHFLFSVGPSQLNVCSICRPHMTHHSILSFILSHVWIDLFLRVLGGCALFLSSW